MKIVFSALGAFVTVVLMILGQSESVFAAAGFAAQVAAGMGCIGLALMAMIQVMVPQEAA